MPKYIVKKRLKIALPMVVLLLTAIACIFLNRLVVWQAEENMYQVNVGSAAEQVNTLQTVLEGRYTTLEAYARSMVLDDDFGFDSPSTLSILGTLQDGDYTYELFLADAQGLCYTADGSSGGVSKRDYFVTSLAGSRAIGKVNSDLFSHTPRYILSVPLKKDGAVVGVLIGSFQQEAFSHLLTPRAYGSEGYTFVCYSTGELVVSTNHGLFSGTDNVFNVLTDDIIIRGADSTQLRNDLKAGREGYVAYRFDEASRLAVYVPAGIDDWMLFNVMPTSVIEKSVEETTWASAIVTACIVMLLALLLFMVINSQMKTIRQIESERRDFLAAARQNGKVLRVYDIKRRRLLDVYREDEFTWRPNPQQMVADGLVAPESVDVFLAFFDDMDKGAPSGSVDILLTIAREEGIYRWFHADYTLVADEDGQPNHAVITLYDNEEYMQRELEYRRWNEAVSDLAVQSNVYFKVDLSHDCVNLVLGERCGLLEDAEEQTLADMVATGIAHRVYHEDADCYAEFLKRERLLALFVGGTSDDRLEVRLLEVDGSLRWYRVEARMTRNPSTDDIELVITYLDTDVEKTEQQRLFVLASTDTLTGILNRRALEDGVEVALASCRPDELVAFYMVDLDYFKSINDEFGHQRGDDVLVAVVETIKKVFREEDLIGRVGGDEFIVFVAGVSKQAIGDRARALCDAICLSVDDIHVTASVGVSVMRAKDAQFDSMYARADAALYRVKDAGKGRYIIDCSSESGTTS